MTDVTLATLRGMLSDACDDRLDGTATSDGGASGATLIDVSLAAQFANDNAIKGRWSKITSGVYDTSERLISAFTQATGTVTPVSRYGTSGTDKVLTGVTHEVRRIQPSKYDKYINTALRKAYPWFFKPKDDWSLVSGAWLPNDNVEDWASATSLTGWTLSGAGAALTQETAIHWYGDYAAKVVAGGGADALVTLSYATYPELLALGGNTVTWEKWCQSNAANQVWLTIQTVAPDGTIDTQSSALNTHIGTREKLSVSAAVPDGCVYITFAVGTLAAKTAYFDQGYLTGPALYEYQLPTDITRVQQVWEGNDWDDLDYQAVKPLDGVETFRRDGRLWMRMHGDLPTVGKKLRIIGYGPLDALTADTSTVDLTPSQQDVLVDGALSELYLSGGGLRDADRARELAEGRSLAGKFQAGLRGNAMVTGNFRPNFNKDMDNG